MRLELIIVWKIGKKKVYILFNEDGGQQKHVTHPTYFNEMGPATKTRYPPYIF